MKTIKRISALVLAVLLMAGLSISAWAQEYDLYDGDITVTADGSSQTVTHCRTDGVHVTEDANPTITSNGKTTDHTLTINTANDNATANVTLSGVTINSSGIAVITEGAGSAVIELDGTNTVTSGSGHAGVEKQNSGSLTITDSNKDGGSLEATGGEYGAGIGGGYKGDGSAITIDGATVTAKGGYEGAGIGGGDGGSGTNITITDATVTAQGGKLAAGIGGGWLKDGTGITITGSEVNATGGDSAAGIGGSNGGSGTGITITGSEVNATGGDSAAGIGGGSNGGGGTDITISGSEVTATGGWGAAGIGGGAHGGNGTNITISGSEVTAAGGRSGAGIGGGTNGAGTGITITGSEVTATGGIAAAGIGGGYAADGSNITITDATVYAAGGDSGAGIGGGTSAAGTAITVSGDAQVNVAASQKQISEYASYGTGAAIGNGGGKTTDGSVAPNGAEVDPDISGLTTGSISYYPAGTTVGQMKDGSVEPTKVVHGTYVPFSGVTFYTLSFDLGGGTIDGKSEYKLSAVFGQKIELPTPEKDGATFKGWKTTEDGEEVVLEAGALFTVKGAASFTAIWE